MGTPLWLEQYPVPADLPNFGVEPDPEELKRLKYLGLIRTGVGLATREPAGTALSAGINTVAQGQSSARAEHRANMELLLKQHQAKQQQIQDQMLAQWRKNFDPAALKAQGFDDGTIESLYVLGPKAYAEMAQSRLGNQITKEGDIKRAPDNTLIFANPRSDLTQLQFPPGAKDFTGVTPLPGKSAIEFTAERNKQLAIAQTTGETGRDPQGNMRFASRAEALGLNPVPLDAMEIIAQQAGQQPPEAPPTQAPPVPGAAPPMAPPQGPAPMTGVAPPSPANATALAAQKRLFILRPELQEETAKLADAVSKGDKDQIRRSENNIRDIQGEISKWAKYAGAAPAAGPAPAAPAPAAPTPVAAPAGPSIRPLDPEVTQTQVAVNTGTFTGLNDSYKKLSESAPEGIVQIYRARKALETAMTGPLSEWKKTGLAFLNETLGFNIKAEEMVSTDVLNKALGTQLLARAKSLGSNPSETDAKRLDTILGTSKDTREGIRDALNYVEVMIRRDVGTHNTRADEFNSKFKVPANIKVSLPTKEEIDARLGEIGGPGVRELSGQIKGQSVRGSGAAPAPQQRVSNATTKAYPNGPPPNVTIDGYNLKPGGNPLNKDDWVKKPEKTLGPLPYVYQYTY